LFGLHDLFIKSEQSRAERDDENTQAKRQRANTQAKCETTAIP
jgi:hypothetical protein